MRGKVGAIWAVMLLATLVVALPARAVVIEDLVTHHPLVAFVSSWGFSASESRVNPLATPNENSNLLSPEIRNLPAATDVEPDDMTVEVVPIRLPKLPPSVVFALYLVGAFVFYTMLVLVAQPSPSEYY